MNKAPTTSLAVRGPVDHDIRTQIIDAATAHFRLYGYEKTTVSDLAKAIGFSKAYIYKFFESKRSIGEHICANCLAEIETDVTAAIDAASAPPGKLRRMFEAVVASSMRLFFEDRRLYDIATSAATEHWDAVQAYEQSILHMLRQIVQLGRESGDFERTTPLEDTVDAIYLVMRPYLNPLLLQYGLDHAKDAPARLAGLVLRSLSP